MKSIEATLNLVNSIVENLRRTWPVDIALAGEYPRIDFIIPRYKWDFLPIRFMVKL